MARRQFSGDGSIWRGLRHVGWGHSYADIHRLMVDAASVPVKGNQRIPEYACVSNEASEWRTATQPASEHIRLCREVIGGTVRRSRP